MKKYKLIGRIFGIAVVFVMTWSIFSGIGLASPAVDGSQTRFDASGKLIDHIANIQSANQTNNSRIVGVASIPGEVAWAEAMVGLSCWYPPKGCYNEGTCFQSSGWCARFAANAYRACYAGGNAIDLWNEATKHYEPLTAAPVGAIAYWAISDYGHVGIHVGSGYIVEGGFSTIRKGYYTSNSNYQGWFYPPSRWPGRPDPSQGFDVGDPVETTACVNVRIRPGIYYSEISYPGDKTCEPQGATGTVLADSVWADGYYWWKIQYDDGALGWSVEDYLENATPCPHSCWDRSALSGTALAALVRSHFPLGAVTQTGESRRVTAYAIAKAESGGNPSACGPVGEIGLWQIHPPSHPSYDVCLLFEEDYNANAAKEISSNGNNWNPWCTYDETCYCSVCTGTYRNYLTEARKHFYPKVTSLSVSSTSINLGETVRIYYSVSDDVGLDRVELWRAIDVNGDGQPDGFNLIDTKPASGQSASGYFDDSTHPSADTYWYGIHVVDNSGAPEAWNCERNSRTGNWPGVYGPDRVEVTSLINDPPNVPSNPSPPNHEPGVSINADLTWTGGDPDPADTVTYDVYFGVSSTPPLVSNDQSGTTYDPGTLAYGTKYYWKVVATDNHGASTIGPLWDFTTRSPGNNPPNTPSNPSPPNHEPGVSINADLTWSGGDPDPADTVTYDVYFGTSSSPSLVSNDQSGTTYDPGTLAYSTEYYWKVVATDNHGATTEGPLWDFTTESAGPGEWKSPSATGDQFNEWINPTNAYSSDNQYADCGLAEPQHAYQDYYNFDFSMPSNVIIQGIEVRCEGHTTPAPTEGIQWLLRLSGDGGSTWSTYEYSPDVNLNIDTTVYIGGSSDLWGESWTSSNFSNANFRLLIFPCYLSWTEDPHHLDHIQVKVYYTIYNPPNTPSDPSPPNHEPGVSINADLNWSGGDPDAGDTVTYDVYFGISSNPPLVSDNQAGTSYDPGTLGYNTEYYWKVVATDNHGATTEGPLWDFTTECPTPSTPSLVSPGDGESGVSTTTILDWSDVSGITSYDVQVCSDSGCTSVVRSANDVGSSQWTISPALSAGTQYWWRARAKNSCGPSSWSSVWSFTTTGSIVPQWTVPIVADAGVEGMNADLEFGIRPGATDGYDSGIDVPYPPPGPIPPPFEAYFSIVDALFPKLNKDFRGATPNEWTLEVRSTDEDIELTWDASGIPSELTVLMNTGTEKIDMKTQNSVVLGAGEYTITISVSEEVEIQLSLKAGWNLVSVPVMPANPSTGVVFAGTEVVYAWDPTEKSYYVPTEVEPCRGYWVAVTGDTVITVTGVPISGLTCEIKAGWNLIGSVMCSIDFSIPDTNPAGKVEPFSYRWDPDMPGYIYSTTIEPAMGHWIAAIGDCLLTLDSPGTLL